LREPMIRLKSVDFPTLGRPTIAMRGLAACPEAAVIVGLSVMAFVVGVTGNVR